MYFLETIALFGIVLYLLYRWSIAKYGIFEEKKIPHQKPVPLIGNVPLGILLGKKSVLRFLIDQYNHYKNEKIYGVYQFRDTFYVIRDIELIKKIAIKDFDSFPNHKSIVLDDDRNTISKSLVGLRDRKWKEMRNTLTPTFTGSKMRRMHGLVNEICIEAVNHIIKEMEEANKLELDLEMKNYFTKFTNDVIATTAFGLKVNTFADENNEFYKIGKSMTRPRMWPIIKSILFTIIPKVMKGLGFDLSDDKIVTYFKQLVHEAIQLRKDQHVVRPDMIQILLEAQRHYHDNKPNDGNEHVEFNDDDLAAQCLIFFIAGFATASACLSFTFYELAKNPHIQDRLYEEIQDCNNNLDGKPMDYDSLNKLKYLDMVLSESLRKWPPAPFTERQCSADYKLLDEDDNLLVEIKKDEQVIFPVLGVHHDSEYFEDPERFDPERFSDENKHKIKPNTYLPFGLGPRNCIGNRFALMETKSIIYHLISHFQVVPNQKTVPNLMDSMVGFSIDGKELFWMKLIKRK